jgi:hypothetical protein
MKGKKVRDVVDEQLRLRRLSAYVGHESRTISEMASQLDVPRSRCGGGTLTQHIPTPSVTQLPSSFPRPRDLHIVPYNLLHPAHIFPSSPQSPNYARLHGDRRPNMCTNSPVWESSTLCRSACCSFSLAIMLKEEEKWLGSAVGAGARGMDSRIVVYGCRV